MPDQGNAEIPPIERHLDDVAAALLAQERQRRLGDPQRAEEVRLELRAGLVLGDLLDHAELAVAGVVDDDVEPPEVLVRPRDRGEVSRPVGDVELRSAGPRRRTARPDPPAWRCRGRWRRPGRPAPARRSPTPGRSRFDVPVMNQTFDTLGPFGLRAPGPGPALALVHGLHPGDRDAPTLLDQPGVEPLRLRQQRRPVRPARSASTAVPTVNARRRSRPARPRRPGTRPARPAGPAGCTRRPRSRRRPGSSRGTPSPPAGP